jgi:TRAP-type C4-dicarboxylate transport system permease small subunit
VDPLDTYRRRRLTVREIFSGIAIVFVAIILLYLLWQILNAYIDPADKNPTQKKDFVQAFAVIVGGFVAFGTLLIGWRNLRHNQRTLLVSQQKTLNGPLSIPERSSIGVLRTILCSPTSSR